MVQIAEGEKARHMSLMQPGGGSEYQQAPMVTQQYDVRNFIPMTLMEPNQNYSLDHDQTALQLKYVLDLTLLIMVSPETIN